MHLPKVALVIGAGDATGGAIARRYARGGYTACVTRRNADKLQALKGQIEADGGVCHAFASDARKEDDVVALVERIDSTIGPIEVMVFNIGANVPESILTETARKYFKVWEMACFGGFLNAREVAKRMAARQAAGGTAIAPGDGLKTGTAHAPDAVGSGARPPAGHPTIIFTGATASLRGSANFAAFSGAKMALRALAQSMARELGPMGIHVAHVVVDGAIDTAFIRDNFPQRYAMKDQGGILNPDHIADTYWMLHTQPRDAWTHELDLRPYLEHF